MQQELLLEEVRKQSERLDAFVNHAEPLLDYVKSEKAQHDAKTAMYQRITESLAEWGIIGLCGLVLAWVWQKLKADFGVHL